MPNVLINTSGELIELPYNSMLTDLEEVQKKGFLLDVVQEPAEPV